MTQLCELISTGLCVEAQNVFEHLVPSAIVGRDTKSCTSLELGTPSQESITMSVVSLETSGTVWVAMYMAGTLKNSQ